MTTAVDRLIVKLAKTWIPPHVSTDSKGKLYHKGGYWRTALKGSGTKTWDDDYAAKNPRGPREVDVDIPPRPPDPTETPAQRRHIRKLQTDATYRMGGEEMGDTHQDLSSIEAEYESMGLRSNWSGSLERQEDYPHGNPNAVATKHWKCSISVAEKYRDRSGTTDPWLASSQGKHMRLKTLAHEMAHAVSNGMTEKGGYNARLDYMRTPALEEGVAEMFARSHHEDMVDRVGAKMGIDPATAARYVATTAEYSGSYDSYVRQLRKIGDALELSDRELSEELIRVPLRGRGKWLSDRINRSPARGGAKNTVARDNALDALHALVGASR